MAKVWKYVDDRGKSIELEVVGDKLHLMIEGEEDAMGISLELEDAESMRADLYDVTRRMEKNRESNG